MAPIVFNPWLAGAGLSAASQFVGPLTRRKNRLVQRKRVRDVIRRTRSPRLKAVLRKRAKTYLKSMMRNKPKVQSKYSSERSYLWRKDKLSRGDIKTQLLVQSVVERCQGVKQENPDQDPALNNFFPGYYTIGKGNSASALNELTLPVYIFDLTRQNNTNNSTKTEVVKQLRVDDLGNILFDVKNSQNSLAVDGTSQWILENGMGQVVSSNPGSPYIQNQWYDIRLKLYGARLQPVTYDVMLVRFKRHYLIPETAVLNVGTDATNLSRHKHFWSELGRNCIVNTILPSNQSMDGMQVIRRQRIQITPSSLDDLDRNPSHVDLRWFIKDGRVRKYLEYRSSWTVDTNVDSVKWIQFGDGYPSNDPYATSRIYLIVRATDMTTTKGATDDMDDSPSFDVCLRRKSIFYPTGGAT